MAAPGKPHTRPTRGAVPLPAAGPWGTGTRAQDCVGIAALASPRCGTLGRSLDVAGPLTDICNSQAM